MDLGPPSRRWHRSLKKLPSPVCESKEFLSKATPPNSIQSSRSRKAAYAAIIANRAFKGQVKCDDKSLVGNKGYRRYLKVEGEGHFVVDEAKVAEEARYDGTWVVRTNTDLPTADVALRFK